MILTISENTQNDLTFAVIAAAALLGAGITQPFKPDNPDGQPVSNQGRSRALPLNFNISGTRVAERSHFELAGDF